MIFSRFVKIRSEMGSLSSLAVSNLPFSLDLSVAGSVMMGTRSHYTLGEIEQGSQWFGGKPLTNS